MVETNTPQSKSSVLGIDLNTSISFIHQLIGGLDKELKYSKLENLITQLLVKYKAFYFGGSALNCYRGRTTSKEKLLDEIQPGGKFTKISQFSSKPSNQTTDFGRCHQPKNPIFYASSNAETLFSELNVECDDFVIVGVWYLKDNRQMRYYHLGALDYFRKTRRIPILVRTFEEYEMIRKNISYEVNQRMGDNTNNGLLSMYIDAFLTQAFSKPAHTFKEYKITSIVSKYLFENRDFDILGYPSVKHFGATNYAMKPETINENFELRNIAIAQITYIMGFGIYGSNTIVEVPIKSISKPIEWPVNEIMKRLSL